MNLAPPEAAVTFCRRKFRQTHSDIELNVQVQLSERSSVRRTHRFPSQRQFVKKRSRKHTEQKRYIGTSSTYLTFFIQITGYSSCVLRRSPRIVSSVNDDDDTTGELSTEYSTLCYVNYVVSVTLSKGSVVQFPEQELPAVAPAAIVPSSLGLYDFEGPRKYVFDYVQPFMQGLKTSQDESNLSQSDCTASFGCHCE
ncbi:hypothetical protein CBL_09171 [Carabus blaptoides fortunei]